MKETKINDNMHDFLCSLLANTFLVFGIFILIGIFVCFNVVMDQIIEWLRHGIWYERDLFWMVADVSCAKTNWIAEGFKGMDLCRQNNIKFTDWVGVNRIINWLFDLHVVFILLLSSLIGLSVLVILRKALHGTFR